MWLRILLIHGWSTWHPLWRALLWRDGRLLFMDDCPSGEWVFWCKILWAERLNRLNSCSTLSACCGQYTWRYINWLNNHIHTHIVDAQQGHAVFDRKLQNQIMGLGDLRRTFYYYTFGKWYHTFSYFFDQMCL